MILNSKVKLLICWKPLNAQCVFASRKQERNSRTGPVQTKEESIQTFSQHLTIGNLRLKTNPHHFCTIILLCVGNLTPNLSEFPSLVCLIQGVRARFVLRNQSLFVFSLLKNKVDSSFNNRECHQLGFTKTIQSTHVGRSTSSFMH